MANPVNASPYGQALISDGFTNDIDLGTFTIAGIGLLTLGFLWPNNGIWESYDNPVMTTWVPCTSCSGGICNV